MKQYFFTIGLAMPIVSSMSFLGCREVRTLEETTFWQELDPVDVGVRLHFVPLDLPNEYFWRGDNLDIDEKPVHQVSLTTPIVVTRHEITQQLYVDIMEHNPSFFKDCPQCPVEKVCWIEAIEFANRLNTILGLPICYAILERGEVEWSEGTRCTGWRLPTEAEWEWMAQSGQYKHQVLNRLAWFSDNADNRYHPVCTRDLDRNGLCDVLGNVQEWVWDVAEAYPSKYPNRPLVDPIGPDEGTHHVFRGGAWNRYGENLSPTIRKDASYLFRNNDLGFRLVRTIISKP